MRPRTATVARFRAITASEAMAADVLRGLRERPKRIASKYFYDARGSELFDLICEQPEYYLTRAEVALLTQHAPDIAAQLGPRVRLVEYGCGSAAKTRLLLQQLQAPVAYVPIELSDAALAASSTALAREFPGLEVQPLCADFTQPLVLPVPPQPPQRTVIYFPGSTIGNFVVPEAVRLMWHMRLEAGARGAALIGIDLRKDAERIERAYNDAAGITAAFTLNLLTRLNRDLGADFDLDGFAHRARYNPMAGRIETHLMSRRHQSVGIGGVRIDFTAGEAVLVEYSYKYTRTQFARMAARAGLRLAGEWRDAAEDFSLVYLLADTGVPA